MTSIPNTPRVLRITTARHRLMRKLLPISKKLAVETYKLLGLSGVARVDAMLGDEDGVAYVLEANTVPGMTATSLVPKAAAAVGISFPELCEKILLSAK